MTKWTIRVGRVGVWKKVGGTCFGSYFFPPESPGWGKDGVVPGCPNQICTLRWEMVSKCVVAKRSGVSGY